MRPHMISHRFLSPIPKTPCTKLYLCTVFARIFTSDGVVAGVYLLSPELSHNFFKAETGCTPFLWHRVPHVEWWGLIDTMAWCNAPKHSAVSACWNVLCPESQSAHCQIHAATGRWGLQAVTAVSGRGELQGWEGSCTRAQLGLRRKWEVRKGAEKEQQSRIEWKRGKTFSF